MSCATCGREHPADESCPADGVRTQAGRLTPRRAASDPERRTEDLHPQPRRPVSELTAGSQVGEYIVGDKIGEGGMGTVYAGVHPVIGKKVALKVLNVGLSDDPSVVQRFVQEARAANEIGHRNIVDIFAFGQLESGRPYYVMEFLKGVSLKERIAAAEPLTYGEAIPILAEVLSALEAAHAAGVVHRDLKPDNIFLAEGRVKLLDFGIAKLLRRGGEASQTRTGGMLGTAFYMAPEQCRSKPVDARSDLYAMGVIMFEIFTGRLPFPGPDYIDAVNGHLSGEVPRPSEIADVPAELESLILRCLEKDPAKRPAQASELREQLLAIGAGMGVLQVQTRASISGDALRLTPRPGQARKPSRRWLFLLPLAALGIAAAVMWPHKPLEVTPALPAPVLQPSPAAAPPPIPVQAAQPSPAPMKAPVTKKHRPATRPAITDLPNTDFQAPR